ncbi:MAG: hypothetical protein KIPDCIKN_00504 [Haliscomenobacter sp.]|nr:hypothetical protein [Haliscomenobacter sp.]
MKTAKCTFMLLAGLLFFAPAFASVQVSPESNTATSVAATASLTKKETKSLVKEKKAEMRSLKKEERRARFFNWLSEKLAGSDTQLVAILLCFFLGGLGIHRVYLKSNPIIILWYFLTLGGFFGLIPLIDFIRLIMGQVDHYEGNNSLFRAFQ